MAAFATPAELNGLTWDAWDEVQAQAALDAATATIQGLTQQRLEAVVGDVVTVSPQSAGVVYLPELPVTGVSLVEVLVPNPVTYTVSWVPLTADSWRWNASGRVYLTRYVENWPRQFDSVRVTYDHGYATIPADLKTVCVEIAARLLDNPYKAVSSTIGGVSSKYGASSGATLRDTELAIIGRYTLLEVA